MYDGGVVSICWEWKECMTLDKDERAYEWQGVVQKWKNSCKIKLWEVEYWKRHKKADLSMHRCCMQYTIYGICLFCPAFSIDSMNKALFCCNWSHWRTLAASSFCREGFLSQDPSRPTQHIQKASPRCIIWTSGIHFSNSSCCMYSLQNVLNWIFGNIP